MNGRHLKIAKDDWRAWGRVNTFDAIRFGHLPGAPCRECKQRYRRMVMKIEFPEGTCTRCGIRWPLPRKGSHWLEKQS